MAEARRILVQTITVRDSFFDTYRKLSDYIRQYVFPGGMLLSDSVIGQQARAACLRVTDNLKFGRDYAKTCRPWAGRLEARKAKIHEQGFNESFFRNWHHYLEICADSFAADHTNVTQVEMAHAA